jgi:hypothetical protein
MQKLTVFSTVLVSAFFLGACDDVKSPVAASTTATSLEVAGAGVTVDLRASPAVVDPGSDRACPLFSIPLDLTLRAGLQDVTVTDFTMRLLTGTGSPAPMPSVTPAAPVPTVQFGSELVAARSVRTIPLVFPLGCRDSRSGTIVVVIGTRDRQGRRQSVEARTTLN